MKEGWQVIIGLILGRVIDTRAVTNKMPIAICFKRMESMKRPNLAPITVPDTTIGVNTKPNIASPMLVPTKNKAEAIGMELLVKQSQKIRSCWRGLGRIEEGLQLIFVVQLYHQPVFRISIKLFVRHSLQIQIRN